MLKALLPTSSVLAVMVLALATGGINAQEARQVPDTPPYTPTAEAIAGAAAQFAAGSTPGQEVFNRNCAACHADGVKFAGTSALNAKYNGSIPGALEDRTDLTPEIVSYFVRNGVSIMPGYRKTQITDEELEALGNYLARRP